MPIDGDKKFLVTKSTRAISIFAKKTDVWKWLIQLGADRCGFYSYNFRVLDVQPEKTLVMEGWGTFSLKEITNQETRLVIRTRENKVK